MKSWRDYTFTVSVKILAIVLAFIICGASCLTVGYHIAMEKATTAACQFVGDDAFYLFIDGNVYEWTRE